MGANEDLNLSRKGANVMGLSNGFVILMGMGTVFAGLIVLIFICMLISFFARDRKPRMTADDLPAPASGIVSKGDIPNRGELIAAVSAAVAEELGTDVSAIRILSFEKK